MLQNVLTCSQTECPTGHCWTQLAKLLNLNPTSSAQLIKKSHAVHLHMKQTSFHFGPYLIKSVGMHPTTPSPSPRMHTYTQTHRYAMDPHRAYLDTDGCTNTQERQTTAPSDRAKEHTAAEKSRRNCNEREGEGHFGFLQMNDYSKTDHDPNS